MKKLVLFFFLTVTVSFLCTKCGSNYKAGNLYLLGYPIDTELSFDIRKLYLDSMANSNEFGVPPKWREFNKLIDINPTSTWRIYFKQDPEEMYLITINSNLVLQDVFNPQIIQDDWVAYDEKMPKIEKLRVIKRTKEEILDRIERMAKKDGCPDSVLYFKPKYIGGHWTESPKWHK